MKLVLLPWQRAPKPLMPYSATYELRWQELSENAIATQDMYMNAIALRDGQVTLASPDQSLLRWNLASGKTKQLARLAADVNSPRSVSSISMSSDGELLSVLTNNGIDLSVRSNSGEELGSLTLQAAATDTVFAPNSDHLLTFDSKTGRILLRDWRTDVCLAKSESVDGLFSCLAVRRRGNLLATGHGGRLKPGSICLWRLGDNKIEFLRRFDTFDMVEDVAFTPDGKWVAAGDSSGVTMFSLAGRQRRHFRAGKVRSLDFSPDGSRLVAFDHGMLRFWDVDTGELVGALALGEFATCVRFVNDRQLVYVLRGVGAMLLGKLDEGGDLSGRAAGDAGE